MGYWHGKGGGGIIDEIGQKCRDGRMGENAVLRPTPTRPIKPRTVALTYTPRGRLSRGWPGLHPRAARRTVLRPRRYRQFRPVAEGGKCRQSTILPSQRPPSPPPTRQIPHNIPNSEAPDGGRGGTGRYARPAGLKAPTSVR